MNRVRVYQEKGDYDNAMKSYIKAVEFCPVQPSSATDEGSYCINSYFNIGICAIAKRKYKTAEKQFSKVIEFSPNDHEAYSYRAECRSRIGKKRKAVNDLEKAIRIASPNWNTNTQYHYSHNIAIAYRNIKRFNDAISYLDRAISIQDGIAIRVERAKILIQMGDAKAAEAELERIRNMGASVADYGFTQGMLHVLKEEYSDAINYLDEVNNDEEGIAAKRELALCYIHLNYMDAARKKLAELREQNFSSSEIVWLESRLATKEGRWADALDLADQSEAMHTVEDTLLAQIRLQRARVHYRQGEFNDAIGECGLVLSEQAMHIEASTLMGLAHLELGEREKAGNIFEKMALNFPGHSMVEGRYGWFLYRNGDRQASAQKLLNLVGEFPNNPEIRYYYAEVCYQMEIYDPAECNASLDVALGLDPSLEEAYALKARILHDESKTAEAMMFLNRAEELGLVHTYASANAAKIYMEKGDYEKALAKAEYALRDAEEAMFQRTYGLALGHSGDWATAIQHLDYCIQLNPDDWQSLTARAYALFEVGEHRLAIRDFDSAIRLSPNDARLYVARGRTLTIFGKYDNAITDYNQAAQINPNMTDAYYQMGRLYLDKRDYPNAISSLENALTVAAYDDNFDEIGMLYNDAGLAKAELGDYYTALDYYSKGINLQANEILYENRARLNSDLGNTAEAELDYQYAININGNDPQRYYELGKVQKVSFKFVDASKSFTFAIQIRIRMGQEVPVDYYRQRGESYLEMGGEFIAAAEGDFMYLKDQDYSNWQPLYYLGRCKYEKGDFVRAVKYYSSALEMNDQHEEVYIARGDAFSMLASFGKAASDYGSAINLNPNEICYYKKKGHANLRNESWLNAVNDYDDAIALAMSQGATIEVELYHGKGRAYTGKAYAEGGDVTYQLAIDNYNNALHSEGVTEKEKYYIKLNMMTTYEKWGNVAMMDQIRSELPQIEAYREPAVLSCS